MDYKNLAETKKIQEYVANMRSAFNKRAVFSDETEHYRTPAEPEAGDTVNIRIRTKANNVDAVYLVSGEKKRQMKLIKTKDGFDYYGTDIELQNESIRYFLRLFPENFAAITIRQELPEKLTSITPLELCQVFEHRTGQRERLCIRFLQTGSAMGILPMTW